MREERISKAQWAALYWAGTLAPAADLLPGVSLPAAGRGAWVSVLLAGLSVWLVGGAMGRRLAGESAPHLLLRGLGPVLGRVVVLIYMVWGVLLLALRMSLCARRLLSAGYRDGSQLFFVSVLAVMLAWMGSGRLSAFARTGQLFLAALLVAAGFVLVLAAGDVRPERLMPIWWTDIPYIIKGTVPAVGVLSWGVFLTVLLRQVDFGDDKSKERRNVRWPIGALLLAMAQGIILGNLGVGLNGQLEAPFFVLAKSVGIQGGFQRIESLIVAVWCFSDLVLAGTLVFALREMLSAVWAGAGKHRWSGVGVVFPAWVLACFSKMAGNAGSAHYHPAIPLALCAIGVVFLGISKNVCGKKCGKKKILWSKRGIKRKI